MNMVGYGFVLETVLIMCMVEFFFILFTDLMMIWLWLWVGLSLGFRVRV